MVTVHLTAEKNKGMDVRICEERVAAQPTALIRIGRSRALHQLPWRSQLRAHRVGAVVHQNYNNLRTASV